MTNNRQRLMQVVYETDYDPSDPEYPGRFSTPFPAEEAGRRIVTVDWSTPGEVSVTWLVAATI